MVKIEFTDTVLVAFYDADTSRKEWYECQMFRGNTQDYTEIVSVSPTTLTLRCLDGELSKVPLMKLRIVSLGGVVE